MTASHDDPLFATFSRADIRVERGEGVWLRTTDGRRFLDFTGGIAVNVLGHAHPHLVDALKRQAETLWHASNLFQIPGQEQLGQRLVNASFADKVFFANSGAEALECAIKTARRWHHVEGRPERFRILTFEGAFHGRTLATIAAGGQAKYLEGFGPPVEGFTQLPFADLEAARAAAAGDDVAAFLVEPIQGEGGVRAAPPEFLAGLRALSEEFGLLLIFDEVQTGIGRTGRFFAYENSGVAPDILASAKGLGGGFPVGACLATADAAKGMTAGSHGTTFGGNPLAMAVGNAVLDVVLADGFLEEVRRTALQFKQSLASLQDRHPDLVEEVRGEGLLIGLKPRVPNTAVIERLRAHEMLAAPAGDNVIRFLPPLNVTADEVRLGMERIEAAFADLDGRADASDAA